MKRGVEKTREGRRKEEGKEKDEINSTMNQQ
jgi:hypothetical protein